MWPGLSEGACAGHRECSCFPEFVRAGEPDGADAGERSSSGPGIQARGGLARVACSGGVSCAVSAEETG